ncbi:uncharacterized protein H6S33_005318 [Morchella sextelata]|uniref:uncharacterized protein n=1 Tax=Morchella sextelata TaxID=1174677 RepID=UPI001D056B1C|nr:uncharacterized protein H6S33_005318 [Morchella sextelata]KAH0613432.1 hypothetical protein H6S33_005318 [Morchella sextelata]
MEDPNLYVICDCCGVSLEYAECIVHCLEPVCNFGGQRYDLCSACHYQGRASGYHQNSHPYELHYPSQIQPHTHLQATLAPRPGIMRINSFSSINSQSSMESQSSYDSSNSNNSQASYDPQPSYNTQHSYNLQPPYNPQAVYGEPHEYMINGRTAAPKLIRLAAAIFEDIDNADASVVWPVFQRRTDHFEPEKCAFVMHLLQFYAQYNVFQRIYDEGQANGNGVAWSDAQVAHMYDNYGWEYRLGQREGTRYSMPMLTKNGFLQMLMCEALVDPEGFSARLNGLLESVGGLEDPLTGDCFHIERESWPSMPDDAVVQQRNGILRMVEDTIEAARGYGSWYPAQESGGWQQDRGMRASKGSFFQRARRFGKNI